MYSIVFHFVRFGYFELFALPFPMANRKNCNPFPSVGVSSCAIGGAYYVLENNFHRSFNLCSFIFYHFQWTHDSLRANAVAFLSSVCAFAIEIIISFLYKKRESERGREQMKNTRFCFATSLCVCVWVCFAFNFLICFIWLDFLIPFSQLVCLWCFVHEHRSRLFCVIFFGTHSVPPFIRSFADEKVNNFRLIKGKKLCFEMEFVRYDFEFLSSASPYN